MVRVHSPTLRRGEIAVRGRRRRRQEGRLQSGRGSTLDGIVIVRIELVVGVDGGGRDEEHVGESRCRNQTTCM